MAIIDLLDAIDLPTDSPVWIFGAGIVGKQARELLQVLGLHDVVGFFDNYKSGNHAGLPVLHPSDAPEMSKKASIVMATQATDEVLRPLKAYGFSRFYSLHKVLKAVETQTNIACMPDALLHKDRYIPIDFKSGCIRAAGARQLVQNGHLETGFQRLRQLANDHAIIHIEDDIAGCAFRQVTDQETLVRFYDEAVKQSLWPGPETEEKQQKAIERGLPTVCINTMLKSGTGFLTKILQEQLDLPQYFITLRGSPNDWLLPGYTQKFAQGGSLSVQHMDASERNMDILAEAGVQKIYLHVRDPRQATVSYMHHLENNLVGEIYALRNWIQPFLPCNYPKMSWKEKTAWHAKNHVIGLIHWVQEWVTAAENDDRFEILMIDFNEFRTHEVATINRILTFFRIDYQVTESDLPKKKDVPHFRAGRNEEWREVFNERQQEIIWELMPDKLCARFGWKR